VDLAAPSKRVGSAGPVDGGIRNELTTILWFIYPQPGVTSAAKQKPVNMTHLAGKHQ